MSRILLHCLHCNTLAPSRAFAFAGSGTIRVNLQGNRETCPNCGAMALILDGVFEVSGDALRILQASSLTREAYARFADLLSEAARGGLTDADFIQRAEAIDPAAGKAARAIVKAKTLWMGMALAVCFALQQCSFNVDVSVDVNRLVDQVTASPATLDAGKPQPEGKR